jgi:hypothetical protein
MLASLRQNVSVHQGDRDLRNSALNSAIQEKRTDAVSLNL